MRGIPDREPEKPKDEGKPCGNHYAACRHCDLCPMNPHPETYAQRIGMAWWPESCETCPSYRTWIGCAQCPYVYTKMEFHAESKPAELMICERHKQCPVEGCGHRKQHTRGTRMTTCDDGPCHGHVCKCIPYHEERDWFVGAPVQLMCKDDAIDSAAELEKETGGYIKARAFRFSQGVRG